MVWPPRIANPWPGTGVEGAHFLSCTACSTSKVRLGANRRCRPTTTAMPLTAEHEDREHAPARQERKRLLTQL